MAFWLNIVALVRRRSVALLAAGVSVLLALTAYFLIPTRYDSDATLVLTSSPTNTASAAGDPNASSKINPLLNFSDGLNTTLAIIVATMNSKPVLDGLEANSNASVTITNVGGAAFLGNNQGPFLFLTGTSASSAQAASDIVVKTAKQTDQILLERQQSLNAPASQLISTLWVVGPTDPVASTTLKIEGAGVGLVLGLMLVVGGVYLRETRRGGFPMADGLPVRDDESPSDSPSVTGVQSARVDDNASADPRPGNRARVSGNGNHPNAAEPARATSLESATAPLRPSPRRRPQPTPLDGQVVSLPADVESHTERIILGGARSAPTEKPTPSSASPSAAGHEPRAPRPRPSAQTPSTREDPRRPSINGSAVPKARDGQRSEEGSADDPKTQLLTAQRPAPTGKTRDAEHDGTDEDGSTADA